MRNDGDLKVQTFDPWRAPRPDTSFWNAANAGRKRAVLVKEEHNPRSSFKAIEQRRPAPATVPHIPS